MGSTLVFSSVFLKGAGIAAPSGYAKALFLSFKPYQLYLPDPSINVLAPFFKRHALFGQKGEIGYFFIGTTVSLPGFHDCLRSSYWFYFSRHINITLAGYVKSSTV